MYRSNRDDYKHQSNNNNSSRRYSNNNSDDYYKPKKQDERVLQTREVSKIEYTKKYEIVSNNCYVI